MKSLRYISAFFLAGLVYATVQGKPCAKVVNNTAYPLAVSINRYAKSTEEIVERMHGQFRDKELAAITPIEPGKTSSIEAEEESSQATLTLHIEVPSPYRKGTNTETLLIDLSGKDCPTIGVRATKRAVYAYALPISTRMPFTDYTE